MVKPVFPGPSSALLLPRQEEGSRGSVGKAGSAARRIPAVIPPAPLGRRCCRGWSAPREGLGSIPGSVLTSGPGMGTFCCSSSSANCCCLPSAAEAVLLESHFSWLPSGAGVVVCAGHTVFAQCSGPWQWPWCFKTSGADALGRNLCQGPACPVAGVALLVPAPDQHCWFQVTSGHRGGWRRDQAQM